MKTNKNNKILSIIIVILFTIIFFVGLVLSLFNNTSKTASASSEDPLAGTWVFNDNINVSVSEPTYFSIDFTCDLFQSVREYSQLGICNFSDTTNPNVVVFLTSSDDAFIVYSNNSWVSDLYRTITIITNYTDISNGDILLSFMQENAIKQRSEYSISYETNGGSIIENTTTAVIPDPLPVPTRNGSTFVDWYLDDTYSETACPGEVINQNITLYAQYELDAPKLYIEGNFLKWTYPVGTMYFCIYKDNVLLIQTDLNEYELSVSDMGCTFRVEAWSDEAYLLHSSKSGPFTYNLDYATKYLVSYETNGGSIIENTTTAVIPDPLPVPTRNGSTFVDWFLDDTYYETACPGEVINQNITLYAQYELDPPKLYIEGSFLKWIFPVGSTYFRIYKDNVLLIQTDLNEYELSVSDMGCTFRVEAWSDEAYLLPSLRSDPFNYNLDYETIYNSGYNAGFNSGYDTGYNLGYSNGNSYGYENGRLYGYREGYAVGNAQGESNGYNNGYADGLEAGYENGYDIAYDIGYDGGYSAGYSGGYTLGYNDGCNYVQSGSLANPVSFLLEPVHQFLVTPLFGSFSVGMALNVVLFVCVALIFIKMFSGG